MNVTYFIGSLVYLVFWTFFFFQLEQKHRKNAFISSIGMGIGGMIENHFFFDYDWFNPKRIIDASAGIEDFISGFGIGGIMLLLGMNTILRLKKQSFPHIKLGGYFLLFYLSTYYILRLTLTYGFQVHSFYSFLMVVPLLILLTMWLLPNVFYDLLKCGLILAGIASLQLITFILVEPDFIEKSWNWSKMPLDWTIFGLPVLDIFWCFLMAMFIRTLRLIWAATVEY